jgi:hypothetical protein
MVVGAMSSVSQVMQLSAVKLGSENYFLLQKLFQYQTIAPSRASSVLLSPRPMRSIRLVVALLHPRDERQHSFNCIPPQG